MKYLRMSGLLLLGALLASCEFRPASAEPGASDPKANAKALSEPVRTFLYEQIAGLNPAPTPEFLMALIALRYTVELGQLRVPVCFIAGGRDRLFPLDVVRQAHAKLPGAEMVVVPDAGHSAYFECPQEFNRALATFLGMKES